MRENKIGIIRFTLGFVFLLLVSGCVTTRYHYEPPADVAGQYCVQDCRAWQNRCLSAREYRCTREVLSRKQERKYDECMDYADSKKDRRKCEQRYGPSERCAYESVGWNCDGRYRQCYTECGGRVITITE